MHHSTRRCEMSFFAKSVSSRYRSSILSHRTSTQIPEGILPTFSYYSVTIVSIALSLRPLANNFTTGYRILMPLLCRVSSTRVRIFNVRIKKHFFCFYYYLMLIRFARINLTDDVNLIANGLATALIAFKFHIRARGCFSPCKAEANG